MATRIAKKAMQASILTLFNLADALKRDYRLVSKEIHRLKTKDSLLPQWPEKKKAIPYLEGAKKSIEQRYQENTIKIKDALNTDYAELFADRKFVADVIVDYYCNINGTSTNFDNRLLDAGWLGSARHLKDELARHYIKLISKR